jgi:hypothetical protein
MQYPGEHLRITLFPSSRNFDIVDDHYDNRVKVMDTIEYFSDFLRRIGAPNFLAIGIAIIVLWLLVSGIRKGLKGKQRGDDHDPEDED